MSSLPSPIEISVVSPVYRAEKIIDELVSRIAQAVSQITENYEIILVEDGSADNSWKKVMENCQKNSKVKGIKLSRNFGQHPAILAGLNACQGNHVVIMDCDLQEPPEEIPKLYQKLKEGYDLVLALRCTRRDGFFKKIFSKYFYKVLSYLTGTMHDQRIANYGIYSKKVIEAVKNLPEYNRYFPVMVRWVGFKAGFIEISTSERYDGKSTYNFRRSLQLAIQIMLSFSEKPLYLTIALGFFISVTSFLFGLWIFYQALNHSYSVPGWASITLSIWFLGGLTIFLLGISSLYIAKTFEQVRNRPIFIVDEKKNI